MVLEALDLQEDLEGPEAQENLSFQEDPLPALALVEDLKTQACQDLKTYLEAQDILCFQGDPLLALKLVGDLGLEFQDLKTCLVFLVVQECLDFQGGPQLNLGLVGILDTQEHQDLITDLEQVVFQGLLALAQGELLESYIHLELL